MGSGVIKVDWDTVPLGEKSDGALARELGCSVYTVRSQRKKRGIEPCTPHGGKRNGTGRDMPALSSADVDLWERLFFEDGLSLLAIVARSDIRHTKQVISRELRKRRGVSRLQRP